MLSRQPWQSVWTDIVLGKSFRLEASQSSSYLRREPVSLPGSFPAYVDGTREICATTSLFSDWRLSQARAAGAWRISPLWLR